MTLHMKGKYVFRVDQDSESEVQIQSTNVQQTLKNTVSSYNSPQSSARPVNSMSLTKTPPNIKPVSRSPSKLVSRSPSKPAILKHSQSKPAAPAQNSSLIRQLNSGYVYPAPPVIPAPSNAPTGLNTTLLVRKVGPPPVSSNIIVPRVLSPSVANLGHTYAKPYPRFSSASPSQAPLPQAPMHLPYNPSAPLILAPSGGQPIYLMPSSVPQETKGVSLLSSSKLGQPTSSAPIFYAPVNNPGMPLTAVQNQGTGLTPVQNQGTVPTMGGKPLISIINPNLQSGSNLHGNVLKHPAKPKTSLQKLANTKAAPMFETGTAMHSLITKLQKEEIGKKTDVLPNIDSDEDLMNCSSPDSVMDMNSDSEVEENAESANIPSIVTDLDDTGSQLSKNRKEASNRSQHAEMYSNSKLKARRLIHKMKKKYIVKSMSPKKVGQVQKVTPGKFNTSVPKHASKFNRMKKKKIDFAKGLWYECPLCMFQYGNLDEYQKHVKTHKGLKKNKLHTCNTCGRQFMTKFHLEKHKTLHRKNAYQCSHCDMSFDAANEVVDHMATVHPS
ncbi:hypothetical protein FSP39_011747 [Pinctada imbricata]|uniref:C2H2-type domain-containing protein n=1 Tax=Pinctada imbricata TaxID=66713 RepID=A0AA88YHA0_PINIB|nr:hypothetical protein FSP39_011747 [Pinctada imbricata]